jgi:Uma2 family endonuclease
MAVQHQPKSRSIPWTYEDLVALPDDGKRYEIVEGELYEMPAANALHATAITNLLTLLAPFVVALGGSWRTAPLDVFIPGGNPVQPDIVVLLPDGRAWMSRRGVEGPPDLIVEVLSPSNRGHDLLTKRALYGRAGVREYWLADPEMLTLEILTLEGDALHARSRFAGDEVVASALLPGLAFPAAAVFAGFDAIRPAPEQD